MFIRHSLLALFGLFIAAPVWAEDIGEIRCVQFSPNGRLAAFASNHSVKLWDTVNKRKVGELKGHTDDINAFVFALDGKTLFTSSRDRTVRQWDLSSCKEMRQFDGPGLSIEYIALSADGKQLAASTGLDVYVCDTTTGKYSKVSRISQRIPPSGVILIRRIFAGR